MVAPVGCQQMSEAADGEAADAVVSGHPVRFVSVDPAERRVRFSEVRVRESWWGGPRAGVGPAGDARPLAGHRVPRPGRCPA